MNMSLCSGISRFSTLGTEQVEEFGDEGIILGKKAHMQDAERVWTTG